MPLDLVIVEMTEIQTLLSTWSALQKMWLAKGFAIKIQLQGIIYIFVGITSTFY